MTEPSCFKLALVTLVEVSIVVIPLGLVAFTIWANLQ